MYIKPSENVSALCPKEKEMRDCSRHGVVTDSTLQKAYTSLQASLFRDGRTAIRSLSCILICCASSTTLGIASRSCSGVRNIIGLRTACSLARVVDGRVVLLLSISSSCRLVPRRLRRMREPRMEGIAIPKPTLIWNNWDGAKVHTQAFSM